MDYIGLKYTMTEKTRQIPLPGGSLPAHVGRVTSAYRFLVVALFRPSRRAWMNLPCNFRDPARDAVGGCLNGVVGEVGVAGGGLHLVVPEQLADHWKALADQQPAAGEGVPQVVDSKIPDSSPFHDAIPRAVQEGEMGAALLSGDHSRMLTLAEVWEIRPEGVNPCRFVRKYPEQKRERFLSDDEYRRLGAALRDAEREGFASPAAIAAIRLLMLTGCRSGEILSLRWENVDPDRGELRLPDSKTGARIVHLGETAIAVLRGLQRSEDGPWAANPTYPTYGVKWSCEIFPGLFKSQADPPSFPRKRETRGRGAVSTGARPLHSTWIPACAGMTERDAGMTERWRRLLNMPGGIPRDVVRRDKAW